jgi:tetratricopeptide (TPR) repeat protein
MKIVLSYRRSDTKGTSGRIFDRLAQHYGHENVFMDVDSIPAGIDFYDHIQEVLNGCSVLLAIIGPRWTGQRRGKSPRIMDETDWVYMEVATALQRKIPVVPILVDGVAMPAREKLPEALQALVRRNAVPVDSGRDFHPHVDRIIRSLDRLLPTTISNPQGHDHTDHVGPKPETAGSHVKQGDAHHRRGDLDQAIAAYSEAIRLNPKLALAYKKRADAYEGKDAFDQAIKDYSEAIRLNPKLALAYNNRGYAHYRNGDLDQAIADYSEAIRIDPKEPLAYENRGDAYEDKDDLDRAIADYSEAIRLHPKYAIAYNNRGYSYYRKGDLDQAIADYSRAIRLNPKLALAYKNRGDAHEDKNDLNQALADYEAALAIEPENSDAIAGRDRVHAARSRLASGPYNRPTLGRGAKGNLVKQIQRKVGAATDGIFGPGTEAAVKQFQRDHGLFVDGIVGSSTWAAFEQEAAASADTEDTPVLTSEQMVNLGDSYLEGRGVPQDDLQAEHLYRKAADLGNATAMVKLGVGSRAWNPREAARSFHKAADLGSATAMVNLGALHEAGHGVAKDDSKALVWYRKAADLGEARAVFRVGFMYEHGRGGLAKDDAEALVWYRKAADLGNDDAKAAVIRLAR